jgi:BASS family bile acid:Na+ symporter
LALIKLFPLVAIIGAVIGYLLPDLVSNARVAIVPLLMLIMLSMGLTLHASDFAKVAKLKSALLLGMVLQFSVMPLAALLVSHLFGLSTQLTIGMLLVGSVAGGTASNVMTFLAKGNVALSVVMTATSTLASVVLTPILMVSLAGSSVDVPAKELLYSLMIIILLPVAVGVLLNSLAGKHLQNLGSVLAPVAMAAIVVIIAIVVALNAGRLASINPVILLAPLVHNLIGLLVGYQAAKLCGFNASICRTLAIEVGMQNSGLATALALKFFTPLAAVPGAIFSVWLNISGAIFAARYQSEG